MNRFVVDLERRQDRFHLLKNLRETIERQLSQSFSQAKVAAAPAESTGATMEAPADRNSHGRQPDLQRHRLLAREGRRALWLERFDRVKALQHEGRSLTAIAKETSLNWRTVAKWTELRELPERRSMNPKSTTPRKYETYLAQRWAEGFRTGRHLLPEIKKLGYTGSLTHLERLLSEWRRSGRGPCLASLDPDAGNRSSLAAMPVPPIAASYLCLKPRGLMTRQELATTTELKRAAPAFATIRQLAMRFRGILHGRDPDKLESWLDDAHRSGLYGLRRFAYTIRNDLAAVRNAITERWSNGQTEGQINRLKTLKRQMYGRAGTELLRARLLPFVHGQ